MRSMAAGVAFIVSALPALADSGAVIAVPSRPDYQVILNGRDASYAIVEGDWGLAKSVHVQPHVYSGWRADPHGWAVGRYYPSEGRRPGYGRREVEGPSRRLPRAEPYFRSWSAQSGRDRSMPQVPYDPPAIILAPSEQE